MSQDREKVIEFAVLTFVGLLALVAILIFLPEANAQDVPDFVKPGSVIEVTAFAPSTERPVQAE